MKTSGAPEFVVLGGNVVIENGEIDYKKETSQLLETSDQRCYLWGCLVCKFNTIQMTNPNDLQSN